MLAAAALELVVRDLRPEDWPAVAAIYRDGIRDGMASFETEVPPWEAWDAAHPIRVVAELDEEVVGWAAAGPVSSRWAYRGVGESSVYVSRDRQGRGFGSSLMLDLIDRSERAGTWTLQTSIFPENEASLNVCRRLGMTHLGRTSRWYDAVLEEFRLAAPAS